MTVYLSPWIITNEYSIDITGHYIITVAFRRELGKNLSYIRIFRNQDGAYYSYVGSKNVETFEEAMNIAEQFLLEQGCMLLTQERFDMLELLL